MSKNKETPKVKGSRLAITGHRMDKLGGYNLEAWKLLVEFAESQLKKLKPKIILSGGALGTDQSFAQACINLKIPYILCQPCDNHESKWPEKSQNYYRNTIVKNAEELVVVSPGEYSGWKMYRRNEYMVDNSDSLLALHDGSSGGTFNCIYYARSKLDSKGNPRTIKPVQNCWDSWQEFKKKKDRIEF